MKKTIITIFVSFAIVMGIMIADYTINNDFKHINVREVELSEIKRYISASGICVEQNKREIKIDLPFTISSVYAEVGDYINKGQKIASLNKESLKNKIEFQSITVSSVDNDSLIAKINNHTSDVLSPISGIVTKINVSEGMEINPALPVMVVSDLENMVIKCKVPETVINNIFVGQSVVVSGESVAGSVEGEVIKIHPVGEKLFEKDEKNFITVDVVARSYEGIRPQTNLKIEFLKNIKKDSIVIPFDSIMFDEEKPYVFINNMGYAAKRYVTLGEEYDIEAEILKGIKKGDKLVLNPKFLKIQEGDKLLISNEG